MTASENTKTPPDFVATFPCSSVLWSDPAVIRSVGETAQAWGKQGCTFSETSHTGTEIVMLGWKQRPLDYGLST